MIKNASEVLGRLFFTYSFFATNILPYIIQSMKLGGGNCTGSKSNILNDRGHLEYKTSHLHVWEPSSWSLNIEWFAIRKTHNSFLMEEAITKFNILL